MKTKILLLVSLLMLFFTTTAGAESFNQKEVGEVIINIEETGQQIHSYYKMPEPTTKEIQTYYPYRLSNGKKEYLKLNDNYTIYTEEGQLILTTIYNDNINDLSVLKNKDNFNKMFDIYPNTHNHTGGSFPSEYGYNYPTKYPSIDKINSSLWGVSNWNFKTQTGGKTELDPVPDPNEQFWTSPVGLAKGNFRYVMSIDGSYQNTFSFGQDIKSPYYPSTRMIEHPWKLNLFDIQEGYFNRLFRLEFEITGKVSDKFMNWYLQAEKENYKLESTMSIKCQENGLVGTLENRTYMFFNYYSVHSVGTYYSSLYAEEIHTDSQEKYYYANLNTTMKSPANNLGIASPEHQIGPYNSIEIYDKETGKKLNSETDVLKVGQKLIKKTYVAYESSLDLPTFNKPIQINSMVLYNDNENLSYADEFYPLISSYNHKNNKLYRVSESLNISGGTITADKLLNIAIYEEKLTVAEKDKNGNFIEKWTSASALPYQKGFYRSDNIEENDNQNPNDDISKITFRVENKNTRDLEVSSMKLTDLSGNEVESVIKGQKYKLTFAFKNIGQEQTSSPINSGLYTNNLQGQYYSESRNLGNSVAGANIYLNKGQENSFTVEIDVPLNTVENVLSLYAFIPIKYDNAKDNVFIRDDDVKKLEVPIKSPSGSNGENLAITDIRLYDSSNKEYNIKNGNDGTYTFEPNKYYKIQVEVKKTAGTMTLEKPEIILQIKDDKDQIQEFILKTNGSFKKAGDTIIYTSNQFYYISGLLEAFAKIPDKYQVQGFNDIPEDDFMVKTWRKSINIAILSAEFIQSRIVLSENADNPPMDLPFKTTYGINTTENQYIETVLATVHNSNNNLVYSQRDVIFTPTQTLITYYGTIPNQKLKDGNNPYLFTINYDRNIFEYDGSDNPYKDNSLVANVFIERKKIPQKESLFCDSYNKKNTWTTTFTLTHRKGSMKSKTVKTKTGTKIVRYCQVNDTKRWTETRSYYENFGVERINFKSPSTIDKYGDVWVNILGNNKGIVRAGQFFELDIILKYDTNRTSMPSIPSGLCSGSRTPNLSSVYMTNKIQLKMEGYGDDELYILNSYKSSGEWSNLRRFFRPPLTSGKDIFGETTTRRYLPVSAENGQINISVITEAMNGYYFDQNHPRTKLQDCVSATIYIQNPLNLRSQTIGGD